MAGKLSVWRSALTASGLTGPTRAVAWTLSTHMSTDGGSAFPSIERLARESGFSRSTVKRALRELEREGWLLVEPSKGGRGRTNRWTAAVPR